MKTIYFYCFVIHVLLGIVQSAKEKEKEKEKEEFRNNIKILDGKDKLVRLANDSCFLYAEKFSTKSSAVAHDLCHKNDLESAHFEGLNEYFHFLQRMSLTLRVKNITASNFTLTLNYDAIRKSHGGAFKLNVNVTDVLLPFQVLNYSDPSLTPNQAGRDSLFLRCQINDGLKCILEPVDTKNPKNLSTPFCQYKNKTACVKAFPVVNEFKCDENELFLLSWNTSRRTFYGSAKQMTWQAALDFCKSRGHTLLDFYKNDTTETKDVMKMLDGYLSELKGFPGFAGVSWTSGRFEPAFGNSTGDSFTWYRSSHPGSMWSYRDLNLNDIEWLDTMVQHVRDEKCMLIVEQDGVKRIRPVDCDSKNFFVCYDIPSADPDLAFQPWMIKQNHHRHTQHEHPE